MTILSTPLFVWWLSELSYPAASVPTPTGIVILPASRFRYALHGLRQDGTITFTAHLSSDSKYIETQEERQTPGQYSDIRIVPYCESAKVGDAINRSTLVDARSREL